MRWFCGTVLFVLFSLFFTLLPDKTLAEGMCVFPTVPSGVTESPFRWDPANPRALDGGGTVAVGVIGGKPPYVWSVSGVGFSLTSSETNGLSNNLQAGSSACGPAQVNVIDAAHSSVTGYVRCRNGRWVLIDDISCGTLDKVPGSGNCHSEFYCVDGKYRYMDSWVAGTCMSTRWHPTGDCQKYPCTPYTQNYCYASGYYPKFHHVGIHYKKRWEWVCD